MVLVRLRNGSGIMININNTSSNLAYAADAGSMAQGYAPRAEGDDAGSTCARWRRFDVRLSFARVCELRDMMRSDQDA